MKVNMIWSDLKLICEMKVNREVMGRNSTNPIGVEIVIGINHVCKPSRIADFWCELEEFKIIFEPNTYFKVNICLLYF